MMGTGLVEGACPLALPCWLITAWFCSYVQEEERSLGKERVPAAPRGEMVNEAAPNSGAASCGEPDGLSGRSTGHRLST